MQDFIASNYQLFLQRSTNGQVLAYVIIFVVIFFITMFSLLGLLSKEYTVPLNPIVSFLIWAIALAFMFFAVFLLWDNEGSSIAYCQEIYGEKENLHLVRFSNNILVVDISMNGRVGEKANFRIAY